MDWSYWERAAFLYPCDVLIVGGGITGLSAAISLLDMAPQLKVTVLDRGFLPIGASTRNAGFACFGSMTELLDDIAQMGSEAAWQLVARRWQGLQLLRHRLGDRRIGFRPTGGYELFEIQRDEDTFETCCAYMEVFNQKMQAISGISSTWQVADDRIDAFGFRRVAHLIRTEGEGLIDTGAMMHALMDLARMRGANLLYGVEVGAWEEKDREVCVHTQVGYTFSAKHVLCTVNGFARRLLPQLDVQPARNQVLITQPVPALPFDAAFHYCKGYVYFRNVDGRILLGGGRHLDFEEECTDELGTTQRIRSFLLSMLREVVLPNGMAQPAYWWSGIMGVGASKSPIVRSLSPRMHVAVRLGGMGVAIGSLIGQEAAVMVHEAL